MVVVEVRQRTLCVEGRGWGPTENTVDRGSQLDEEDEEDDEEEDEKREEKEEDEDEEEATDIKSNNPHLAGGELKPLIIKTMFSDFKINYFCCETQLKYCQKLDFEASP